MCHRSDRGWRHTRWHLAHSVARSNLWHSYKWRSHQCSHTDRRARRGWYLMMRRKEVWVKAEQIRCLAQINVMCVFSFLTNAAFVSVNVASVAYISRWTVAVEHATDGVGVTLRALSTGVTDTGIVSMAEQTWKKTQVDKEWVKCFE